MAKEELESLFTSLNGGPRQRRVPLGVRIRIPHVGALYEPFYEEKVIFCQIRNKEFHPGGKLWVWNRKKIKGRSALTLDGSSEANRSISFGHPRLDFGAGDRRMGRVGGREEGERPIETMAGILYGCTSCFFQISNRLVAPGVITLSRDRHSAGSRFG